MLIRKGFIVRLSLVIAIFTCVVLYFQIPHYSRPPEQPLVLSLPTTCVGLINETLWQMRNIRLHANKLKRLQQNSYVDVLGQENCQTICSKLPVLSPEEQKTYKPVGNFSFSGPMETNMSRLTEQYQSPADGGGWVFKTSEDCNIIRKSGVAVVIVIRDRWTQLTGVLSTLIPLLRRQHLCYQIFVVEQYGQDLFNRGMLFNVGFMEAAERFQFDCVVFHDADLAPTNDLNPYGCDAQTKKQPVHLGVALDTRNFKLNYPDLIGGVLKVHNSHFVAVNGHSNLYWGWGQEDDDMAKRFRLAKIGYLQMSTSIARYRAVPHNPQRKTGNPRKAHLYLLRNDSGRMYYEGLSSLTYRVIRETQTPIFTHILVDLGKVPTFYDCDL